MSNQKKNPYSDYVKYSSLAIQMGVIIFGFACGGVYADKWLKLSFPVFTVVLSISGVGLALYIGLKDLIHPKK